MKLRFWEKKVNPLKTNVERAVEEIMNILYNNEGNQGEIIKAVIKIKFPGYGIKAHPYTKNPRKEKIVDAITA
jgi:hypothetical protein